MKKRRFFSAAAGLLTTALILTAACLPGVAAGADTVARITVADAAFDRETACVRDVPMGGIAADAVRQAAGADIAVIPCGDFSDTDVGVKKFSRADAAALATLNRAFHGTIEHLSDKIRILRVIESQEEYIIRFSAMTIASIVRRSNAHQEHHQMVELLEKRDLPGMMALMQHHLEESKETCLQAIANRQREADK